MRLYRCSAVVVALLAAGLLTAEQVGAAPPGVGGARPEFGGFSGGGRGGYFSGGAVGYGGDFAGGGFRNNLGGYANARGQYNGYGSYPPSGGGGFNGNVGYGGGYGANGAYGGYGPGYTGGPGYNPGGGGGYGYRPPINNNPNNNAFPVIVPYPIGGGNSYGSGDPYGQNGGSGATYNSAPQRRFAPAASNYLYGQDGSVSFYATPPGNEAPIDPAPSDGPTYYTPDTGSPPPVPIPSPTGMQIARVLVRVPSDAHLWFEGAETRQSGADRTFKSPPLEPGRAYLYDVKARWWEDGKPVQRTRTITVLAGQVTKLDMTSGQ
jgi:uncharacterized protein (TIGR03000 family)